jgi:hypothetical protein
MIHLINRNTLYYALYFQLSITIVFLIVSTHTSQWLKEKGASELKGIILQFATATIFLLVSTYSAMAQKPSIENIAIGISLSVDFSVIVVTILFLIKCHLLQKTLKTKGHMSASEEELIAATELYAATKGISPDDVTESMANDDFDHILDDPFKAV